MLFKACLIIIVIGVCVWADQECIRHAQEECKPENLPQDIPETVEEIIRDCNIIKETARCFITFFDKNCTASRDEIRPLENILKYLESECQEDSRNFQAISSNIGCITPAARSLQEACSWENFSDEEIDNLVALLRPLCSKNIHDCPSAVENIICASHIISKRCGSDLKDVVTDILEGTKWNYQECNEKYLEELLPFKEYFETLLIKQDMFEDTSSDEE